MKENDDRPGGGLQKLMALIIKSSPAEREIIFAQIDEEIRQRDEAEQNETIRLTMSN